MKSTYEKPELGVKNFAQLEDVYADRIAPSSDPNANGVANGKAQLNPLCASRVVVSSGF